MTHINFPKSETFVVNFDNIVNIETKLASLECVQTPIGTFSLRFIEKFAVNELKKLFEANEKEEFSYNDPAYILNERKICAIKLDEGYCFDLA